MSETAEHLTDRERRAIADGQAYLYRGRVIPIIRGAEGGEEDEEAKKAAEAAAKAKAEEEARAAAEAKTFTQAELDKIVQDRLARDRKDRPSDDELTQLRDAAKRLEELEQANKTELEKAQARADKAEQEAQRAAVEARETRLRSAIIAEAARGDREKKVADPEGALAHLTGVDSELLELDDQGSPTDIAKAMDSLLEKRPYLVASAGGARPGGADQGARSAPAPGSLEAETDPAKVRETVKGLRS